MPEVHQLNASTSDHLGLSHSIFTWAPASQSPPASSGGAISLTVSTVIALPMKDMSVRQPRSTTQLLTRSISVNLCPNLESAMFQSFPAIHVIQSCSVG